MSDFATASMACDSDGCFGERAAIAARDHSVRRRMTVFGKVLPYVISFTIAICALESIGPSASAAPADITGTWEVTIYYQPDDSDYLATYVLKQDGEKITGTYHGMHGPAEVTGTIKANDVTLVVTVQSLTLVTAHFSGKLTSVTKMSGTVTGTSDKPRKWSAEKKK